MNRLQALISLNSIEGIGSVRLQKLLEYFQKPENILNSSRQELTRILGPNERLAEAILSLKHQDLDKEFSLAKKLGLKIITIDDPDYPVNLKNIFDPPLVLYVKGKIEEEDKFSIAIVGSRRASLYGLQTAEKFSKDLAGCGLTVVSGMARGVDTSSHRGALIQGGRTLAVMGSGFNHIYPAENKKLADEIAQNGAVISEFPINTEPFKHNFPRRNRVISGLSLGVLVVEAARNSGALITADFALEQGREVFALPGKIDSGTSFGTNELIKQGAKLTLSIDDILEELILPLSQFSKSRDSTQHQSQTDVKTQDEFRLYDLIKDEPVQLDELAEKSNMDIPKISGILLRLQIKKLVQQLPGKNFVKKSGYEN